MRIVMVVAIFITILVCCDLQGAEDINRIIDQACDISNIPESQRQNAEDLVLSYDKQIIPVLLTRYEKSDFGRRQIILRLLSRVGGLEEEAFLLKELKEGDFFVSNAARQSLPNLYSRFTPEQLAARIIKTTDNSLLQAQLYGAFLQTKSINNLSPVLENAVVDTMRSNSVPLIKTACATILRYGKTQRAVSALLSSITVSSDQQLLIEICTALRYIRPRGEAKELEQLATNGSPDIEVNALGALAAMGYDGVDKALVILTNDKSFAVRIKAYEFLAHYGGMKYIKEIAVGLKDSDAAVRLSAVEGLGYLANPQASAYLRSLMGENGDNSPEVRAAAAIAFHRGNRIGASGLLMRDAANINPKQVHFRIEAIKALGVIRAREGLRVLYEALDNDNPEVSAVAAQAIGRIGDQSAIDILQKKYLIATGQTRTNCRKAIEELSTP